MLPGFIQRPFQSRPDDEWRSGYRPGKSPLVTEPGRYIDDRGNPSPVSGAKSSRIEIDTVQNIRRKSREESQDVKGLIKQHPVE